MTHLGERITDFVFAELSVAEMDEARRHVAECTDCRLQVQQFEKTRSMLKFSTDVEPPHRIVFEIEKPSPAWRWLAPIGVAAAIVIAVLIAAPMHIQWQDSQLSIAFGRMPAPAAAPSIPAIPPAAAPPPQVIVQPVDYERIRREFQDELRKRDVKETEQFRQLQANLTYLDAKQLMLERQNTQNATDIQFAVKSGVQD